MSPSRSRLERPRLERLAEHREVGEPQRDALWRLDDTWLAGLKAALGEAWPSLESILVQNA